VKEERPEYQLVKPVFRTKSRLETVVLGGPKTAGLILK
jgi:hypothetical protein